jgi:hypothetical protein
MGLIMGKLLDIAGLKFNRLTVIGKSNIVRSSGALWECRCDCGTLVLVNSLKLRGGSTKSCGCYRSEVNPNLKHGVANKTRTYRSWKEMRQRCLNPNSDKWKWYGGRGITISKEWDSFEVFLLDMGERPEGKSIDRIDSDGNYCKDNCKWSTPKEQAMTNRGVFKKGMIPHNKSMGI